MKNNEEFGNRNHLCPLCGRSTCYSFTSSTNQAIWYDCDVFNISLSISSDIDNNRGMQYYKYDNLIFEHCNRYRVNHDHAWFYYIDERNMTKPKDGWINLSRIPYPDTFSDKIDRVLMNLSRMNHQYGAEFSGGNELARAYFDETAYSNNSILGMAKMLVDLGYLTCERPKYVSISAKGWQRIDKIERNQQDSRKCFVAIAYGSETETIREAIRQGTYLAGYDAILMDEQEHNNQIIPEMFHDIGTSRFLIMDVTIPNQGAYYEAGYAQGKGKDVIITCREKNKRRKRPHFDIQQQPIIYWKDEEDLITRLEKRIKATIGVPFEALSNG